MEDVGEFKNWDVPSAIDYVALEEAIVAALSEAQGKSPSPIILIEGFLLYSAPALHHYYNSQITLDLPLDVFKDRRFKRDHWLRENPTYFDLAVLPAYHEHGATPSLDHCRKMTVNGEMAVEDLHNLVFDTLEAWRSEILRD